MQTPASIRSLAQDLGLSIATVSEALRDSPQVKPETKERVLKAAAAVGYRRNPLLGATFSALRMGRHQGFSGTLALVDVPTDSGKMEPMPFHREIMNGATDRARELGFNTELFFVGRSSPALSVTRLNSVLRARGIPGVIFLPFDVPQDFSGITLDQMAAVSMEHRLTAPHLNTIQPDHYLSMRNAVQMLTERGYRRIGLCLETHKDERADHKWSSGFISYFRLNHEAMAVEPLIASKIDQRVFNRWFDRHRPDIVISHEESVMNWIEARGLSVPKEVGFFRINILGGTRATAGLDLLPGQLGATAVEAVVGSLHRREFGIPAFPKSVSIQVSFRDGPTLVPARGTSARKIPVA